MKSLGRRLEKLEAAVNPRGKQRRSDEEEEKHFLEAIKRIKSLVDVTEEEVKIFRKLFEIEKEQAKKEKRPLETWWNVFWLAADDKLTFQDRERAKRQHGCRPLTPEHQARVKELLAQFGCSLVETM